MSMQTVSLSKTDVFDQTEALREILMRLKRLETSAGSGQDMVRKAEPLLAIAIDTLDDLASDADVYQVVESLQEMKVALVKARRRPAARSAIGLLRALGDPDTRRGIQFMLDSLKIIGSRINRENEERR